MKDVFDPESKKALIDYRIERAYETLKEAKYNSDGGFYHAAVNRMYYACFYAVIALLLKYDIQPRHIKALVQCWDCTSCQKVY